jgi:Protein of unknown function (DUF3019)
MGITKQLTWKLTGLLGLLFLITPIQLAAEPGYGLTVSPEKCFVLEVTDECEIAIKLEWRVETKSSYCLYLAGEVKPLNCWKENNQGSFEYLLITNTDTQFELRSIHIDHPTYQTKVRIFKQIKRLKKRRRNPWSFY